jgi:hypothetical protein
VPRELLLDQPALADLGMKLERRDADVLDGSLRTPADLG